MIDRIQFENFKALRYVLLPLSRFTLIVGPNGSGKSSVFQAMVAVRDKHLESRSRMSVEPGASSKVSVGLHWQGRLGISAWFTTDFSVDGAATRLEGEGQIGPTPGDLDREVGEFVRGIREFSFDPDAIASPVALQRDISLGRNGAGLAGVLDRLRNQSPDQFESLVSELHQWLPEFDQILFDTTEDGKRSFALRTSERAHVIPASELSSGTLVALAILSLVYSDVPPTLVCIEEPDRALHPRLFRHLQDALYRLAYPNEAGQSRHPIQVIATTHSPYLLDLYRDHPDEVVIAQKEGLETQFKRLSDLPHFEEIVDGAGLGEIWYSGILGGVPIAP